MKTTLEISGMHCAACSSRVQNALSAIEGVTAVTVDLSGGLAEVTASQEIAAAALCDAVEQLGFDAEVV